MALPHYVVPRALDEADQFMPGFTSPQFVATCLGVAAGWLAAQIPEAVLPISVKAWLILYLPIFGLIAKRRLKGRWETLDVLAALWHYFHHPRRCVYAPESLD